MESNLSNAFLLLITGMSTVFFILFLVISCGNVLIRLVNSVELDVHEVPFSKIKNESLTSDKVAVIKAVVDILTQGKGKIEKIEKR